MTYVARVMAVSPPFHQPGSRPLPLVSTLCSCGLTRLRRKRRFFIYLFSDTAVNIPLNGGTSCIFEPQYPI